jgi:hypothetical protein
MDVAQSYKRLNDVEERALLAGAQGIEPIFQLGNGL